MQPFSSSSSSIGAGRRCDGERCPAPNSWPVHHISHRSNLRRLCTSCVLRQHHGFFCSLCLQLLLDSPPSPSCAPANTARCLRCPAAAHAACLPNPSSSSTYLCPVCERPEGFSYFPVGEEAIGAAAARALLCASRIAAGSMSRAAAAARVEAERRTRLAAAARKVAEEMVERVMVRSFMRKEGIEDVKVKKKKKRRRRKKMVALSTPSGLLKKL